MRTTAFICSLIFVFSIPWENSFTVSGLGTLSRGLGIIASVAWIGAIITTGNFKKISPIYAILFLFIIWNIATLYWSMNIEETMVRSKTYLQLGIMILIFWDLFETPKAVNSAMQAYVLGCYISIIDTIALYLSNQGMNVRFSATGFNPNDLSLILVIGIPMAWYLVNSEDHGPVKIIQGIVNFVYIPAAFFVLFLTASRGSLMASIPAILYIILSLRRYKWLYRCLFLLSVAMFVFVLLPYIPQSNIERLSSINKSISEADLGGRMALWKASIKVFTENPILGIGSGLLSSHNVFLSVLGETGLVGLTFFFTGIIWIFIETLKKMKQGQWIWIALFCVWLLGATVHTWEDRKPTWLIFSFIVISGSISSKNEYSLE